MATTFMHLYVARALAEDFPISDKSQYYLGVIAPDSVNLDGFAEKSVRWESHVRDKDFMKWYEKLSSFYRENRDTFPDRDLLLGYAVHILTDLAWDGYYFNVIRLQMLSLENPPIPDWQACVEDCFRYESSQIHADWWTREVKKQLQSAKPLGIHSVSAELLERYRRFMTEEYEKTLKAEPSLFMDNHILDKLAEETREKGRIYL